MIVEPRERLRFGCSLCLVFCLHEDLKLEYKRIRFQEEKEDCQKVFKFSKSRCCDDAMEKSERERVGERESKSEGGERVNLCASDGAESIVCLEPWNSRKKSSFKVESKTFEIEVEKKKGKVQVILVERKRGVSSWVKMGSDSLGLFVESLALCIKDT